jgi:hypothetical protein
MNYFLQTILLLSVTAPALATEPSFGKLPATPISTNITTKVSAEICRDHLFDPSSAKTTLPNGYRLILAAEAAKEDPDVASLLKANPKIAAHAVGSLCFMSVGSFDVDGVRAHAINPMPAAFWWVRATGPRDKRMLGKVEWLQLASWYPREGVDRQRVLATDPMAQFVDIEMRQKEPGLWHMRLTLPAETIEAEVRGSGQRKKRKATEPGFMSVPFTGDHAGSFWVITYYGHHHQSAKGQCSAHGKGVFSDALRIPGEAKVFNTIFQDGWSALSGLYRPVP